MPRHDRLAGLSWQLRISRRARYARLRIRPYGGLEVVIPPGFPRHRIAELVADHADWARRHLARQQRLRAEVALPRALELAFDGSATPIQYRDEAMETGSNAQGELFEPSAGATILLSSRNHNIAVGELRQWLRRRAQELLPALLEQVATTIGIDYRAVSIRSQKTRWGSCSSKGNISLNDQLLFLPRETVIYLMVHELCHRHHMNHSKAFWELVASHYPGYREQEAVLSRREGLVPDWFLLDLYR